jgi:hypothetical protein
MSGKVSRSYNISIGYKYYKLAQPELQVDLSLIYTLRISGDDISCIPLGMVKTNKTGNSLKE